MTLRRDDQGKQIHDVCGFAQGECGVRLRSYQYIVAARIANAITHDCGLSFVVIMPRQSGKNEMQAVLEAYLLALYKDTGAEIVKVSPTWKPQSLNAMRRLERLLRRSIYLQGKWRKESGYIYRVGEARIFFLSGEKQTNIVGATASTLLECDEAQDVSIAKWDREISPMAASRNTTRIFWGTTWTRHTLLYREKVAAHQAELLDGVRRLFTTTPTEVSREVPAYGRYVESEIAKLGRQHPHVRTQYFSEELDASGGMFPEARRLLMQGRHPHQVEPRGWQAERLPARLCRRRRSRQRPAARFRTLVQPRARLHRPDHRGDRPFRAGDAARPALPRAGAACSGRGCATPRCWVSSSRWQSAGCPPTSSATPPGWAPVWRAS